MPIRRIKKNKSGEHDEQVIIFNWAKLHEKRWPCLKYMYATLNGVKLTKGQAAKMKAAGNKKGVPDIVLPFPCDGFHGLYVELKIPGNTPTQHQKDYMEYLNSVGYFATTAYGYKEAIQIIENYISGNRKYQWQLVA